MPVARERDDDDTQEAARARGESIRERTGIALKHVAHDSFDFKPGRWQTSSR